MMPIMDGAATIRALQQLDPEVRIIAVSGMLENGEAADAEDLPVQAILSKPYTMERLLTTLREVLRSGTPSGTGSVLGTSNGQQDRDGASLQDAYVEAT